MSAPVDVRYRVVYQRRSDGAEFRRDFASHEAAKNFAGKKKSEPGWVAGWPFKVEFARTGGVA